MLIDINLKSDLSKSKYELTLAEFPLFILTKKRWELIILPTKIQ